jgi:hypothetical protein
MNNEERGTSQRNYRTSMAAEQLEQVMPSTPMAARAVVGRTGVVVDDRVDDAAGLLGVAGREVGTRTRASEMREAVNPSPAMSSMARAGVKAGVDDGAESAAAERVSEASKDVVHVGGDRYSTSAWWSIKDTRHDVTPDSCFRVLCRTQMANWRIIDGHGF